MTTNEIRGGLMCDGCECDLGRNGETVFFSCRDCDFDLCLACCSDSQSAERANRADAGRENEPEQEPEPAPHVPRARKAQRLPSRYARNRAANAEAARATNAGAPWSKRKAQHERMAAVRRGKQPKPASKTKKRKHAVADDAAEDSDERSCKKRKRGRH